MPAPSTPPIRIRLQTAAALRPMPLLRLPKPFDHPDWIFEVKHAGFRALAHITGHSSELRSRNGHTFKHLAAAVLGTRARRQGARRDHRRRDRLPRRAGRSNFRRLLFCQDWPYFYAFDLLAVDGEDLREWPLADRKRRLRTLIPSVRTRLLYVDHVQARGKDFFEVIQTVRNLRAPVALKGL